MRRAVTATLLAAMAATTACSHVRTEPPRRFGAFGPGARCREQHHLRAYVGEVATDHVVRMTRFYSRADIVLRVHPAEESALTPRPGRLLLEVNDQGRIARIYCG